MKDNLVSADFISDVGRSWLCSNFVAEELDKVGIQERFSESEIESFANYLPVATLHAPTHGITKYPKTLVLNLGIRVRNLFPAVEMERLPKRFSSEPCERIDTKHKLGIAAMDEAVAAVPEKISEFGQFTWLFYNSHHFGFSAYYANRLADEGYIVYLECTGSRGDQVIPLGGKIPRLGTNPICFAFPTKEQLGFNVCADFSTSACAMGKVQRAAELGLELKAGLAFTEDGEPTTDPKQARSLGYEDHRDYAFGLRIETLAALMGGGDPWLRGKQESAESRSAVGGSWMLTVTHPDFYRGGGAGYDPVQRATRVLEEIVKNNGSAHLPGLGFAEREQAFKEQNRRILLQDADLAILSSMAEQAKL